MHLDPINALSLAFLIFLWGWCAGRLFLNMWYRKSLHKLRDEAIESREKFRGKLKTIKDEMERIGDLIGRKN